MQNLKIKLKNFGIVPLKAGLNNFTLLIFSVFFFGIFLLHIFLPKSRSRWNQPADYDVFFEADELVFSAHNRRFYQNSGRVLERRGGQKTRSGQSHFVYGHNR